MSKHGTTSLNLGGKLFDLHTPMVMGILNATPDSFFAESRMQTEHTIRKRAEQILAEGGSIIDVGACSTRPGAEFADIHTEMQRLRLALTTISKAFPDAIISVDTFRADVAKMCHEEFGIHIINDVGGGSDPAMFDTVAKSGIPYVLTFGGGSAPSGSILRECLLWFAEKLQLLHERGAKDIILDPGFGFGKTLEENHKLFHQMEEFCLLEHEHKPIPLLVGISRKSMIYKKLGTTPENALNGTTALHALAIKYGANILRVHDVKEAVEVVRIMDNENSLNSLTKAPCSTSE